MEVGMQVREIALYMAEEAFVPQFRNPDNFIQRQEEGLGMAVANWAHWDGSTIMRVFAAALEDANLDKWAAKVEEWLEASDGN